MRLPLLLVSCLVACGGTITGNGGPDGSTTGACATLGACECYAAGDRCAPRTEGCWCPDVCGVPIDCVCAGGRFLACEDHKPGFSSCTSALTAVQAKCAGQPFLELIGGFCSSPSSDPTCIAGCLAKLNSTGSCSEIDCAFCLACLCTKVTTPNPFRACLATCGSPPEGASR